MDPKKILAHADSAMDPLGIIVVICAYFANKFWSLELTVDDVLLASIGFGAARTLWERSKRKNKKEDEED